MYRQVPSTDCSFIVNYIYASPNPPGIIFTPNKEALMARQTPPHSPWDCSAHLHRTSSPSASATENNTFKMKWMHPVQSPNNNHLIPNYYTWGLIIITSDKENCKLKLCCMPFQTKVAYSFIFVYKDQHQGHSRGSSLSGFNRTTFSLTRGLPGVANWRHCLADGHATSRST